MKPFRSLYNLKILIGSYSGFSYSTNITVRQTNFRKEGGSLLIIIQAQQRWEDMISKVCRVCQDGRQPSVIDKAVLYSFGDTYTSDLPDTQIGRGVETKRLRDGHC